MCKFIFKYLESDVLTPCTPLLKSEGVPIIGDLIGAGASVYNTSETNKTNADNVAKTNETNYQIAKEVNDMSEKQFQANLKWLQQQYYENQDREDTRYQRMVKDMQASGLNPALQNGQPSGVSSVGAPPPSSFHAAQMEAAHYDPLNLDFDPLSEHAANAINSYYQNKKTQAETENMRLDSQTKAINNVTQLNRDLASYSKMLAETDKILADKAVSEETKELIRQQRESAKQLYELTQRQFEDLANQPKYQNSVYQAQEENIQSSTALNKIEAQYKPMLLQSGIRLSQSQSSQLLASAASLWEEAKNSYHYRHEIMPLEEIQRKLANGISSIIFKGSKSYEDFIKDNDMSDYRNFIKTFGELLFRLAK